MYSTSWTLIELSCYMLWWPRHSLFILGCVGSGFIPGLMGDTWAQWIPPRVPRSLPLLSSRLCGLLPLAHLHPYLLFIPRQQHSTTLPSHPRTFSHSYSHTTDTHITYFNVTSINYPVLSLPSLILCYDTFQHQKSHTEGLISVGSVSVQASQETPVSHLVLRCRCAPWKKNGKEMTKI